MRSLKRTNFSQTNSISTDDVLRNFKISVTLRSFPVAIVEQISHVSGKPGPIYAAVHYSRYPRVSSPFIAFFIRLQ